MLYTNLELLIEARNASFGEISGVVLGEQGWGKREVFLPVPEGMVGLISGLRPDLTIRMSKTGRPKIVKDNDSELYLILSSARSYTRRGNGRIKAPKTQKTEVVARGYGADGDIGRWNVLVLKAHEEDVYRVLWSGSRGYSPTLYVVHAGAVSAAEQQEAEDLYDLLGLQMPFSLKFDGEEPVPDLEEWAEI